MPTGAIPPLQQHGLSKDVKWTVLALLFSSGVLSTVTFYLSWRFDQSQLGTDGNPCSASQAAWPGMVAGLAAFLLATVLIEDALNDPQPSCCKKTRKACGWFLLLFCVATGLTFAFATAMTGKDIYDKAAFVDHGFQPDCSPNGLWYVAMGESFFGFLSCALTCCLIGFQFLRSETQNCLLPPVSVGRTPRSDLGLAKVIVTP